MKSWQFTAYNTPMYEEDVPRPRPAAGEVLIYIRAAGLCHSDVRILRGELPPYPEKKPVVLGHEIAGEIIELGEGITDLAVGDRVGIFQLKDGHGNTRDGGYEELLISPTRALVRIPEGTTYEQAAISTDAGMTSYHAVVAAGGVTAGSRVGIIGLGGLGTIGAQVSMGLGAHVWGAEANPAVRERAASIGLDGLVDDVKEFEGLDLDVIIDFAGFGETTAGAIEVVKPHGRVVQVGLGRSEATINTYTLTTRQVELVCSFGGDENDIAAVYKMFARGALTSPIETIGFDDVPDGLKRLEEGDVQGRLMMVND